MKKYLFSFLVLFGLGVMILPGISAAAVNVSFTGSSATFSYDNYAKGAELQEIDIATSTLELDQGVGSANLNLRAGGMELLSSDPGGCGDNLLTGGTVSDSGYYVYDGSYAFDGDDETFWIAYPHPEGATHWAKYQLATSTKINKIGFLAFWDDTNLWAEDIGVLGSNDDSTYTQLSSSTLVNEAGKQYFTFTNDTSYLYYKFAIASTYDPSFQVNINTIEGFDCEGIPPTPTSTISTSTITIPRDFTSVCVTQNTASGTIVGCYEPWKVSLFYWMDFIFFCVVLYLISVGLKIYFGI